jgi:hypothetical protein
LVPVKSRFFLAIAIATLAIPEGSLAKPMGGCFEVYPRNIYNFQHDQLPVTHRRSDERFGDQEVQEALADQRAGSPLEVAAIGLTGQTPCDNSQLQSQADALTGRMNALFARAMLLTKEYENDHTAKIDEISRRMDSLSSQILTWIQQKSADYAACFGADPPNCTAYYNDTAQIAQLEAQRDQISAEYLAYISSSTQELLGKVPDLNSQWSSLASQLQIVNLGLRSSNCNGASVMALPPSFSMAAIAKRFGFADTGSQEAEASSRVFDSQSRSALDQLGRPDKMEKSDPWTRNNAAFDRAQLRTQVIGAHLNKADNRLNAENGKRAHVPGARDRAAYYDAIVGKLRRTRVSFANHSSPIATKIGTAALVETSEITAGDIMPGGQATDGHGIEQGPADKAPPGSPIPVNRRSDCPAKTFYNSCTHTCYYSRDSCKMATALHGKSCKCDKIE